MNDWMKDLRGIKSETKQLREFGLVVGCMIVLIGGLLWWKKGVPFVPFAAIGGLLALLGAVFPKILFWPQKAWMAMALTIGWFVGRFLLLLIYFLVVTPISAVLKLQKKELMTLGPDAATQSYWTKRAAESSDPVKSEKQY